MNQSFHADIYQILSPFKSSSAYQTDANNDKKKQKMFITTLVNEKDSLFMIQNLSKIINNSAPKNVGDRFLLEIYSMNDKGPSLKNETIHLQVVNNVQHLKRLIPDHLKGETLNILYPIFWLSSGRYYI